MPLQFHVDGARAAARIPQALKAPEASLIDIIFLIEQLERLITTGRNMPLTSNVIIDQARALDLLDQLRVAVPEEVRAAKRINDETERIVERAQEEGERILARAQEQAAFLIEERELTKAAEIKSAIIIGEGQREADEIRRGADEYAQSVLVRLEGECIKALQSIKHGLALLDERHGSDNGRSVEELDAEELAEPEPTHAQL